eukprot:TRINITY_DN2301_c0_g1_i8.p1 TRINITY_DN2301_c0_g1~~TRINITY_DN2301_c0_g1_i8.p1  ORF type:complete len:275 (-),score=50.44 TRINITY_DN2301_c0_g1_i8:1353-2177(-)
MLEKYAEKHIKPATPPKQEYVVKPKKKEDPRPTLEQRIKAQSENERKLYQQLVESRTIDPEPRNRYEADYYRQADPNMMEPKHIEKRLQVKFNMKFNKQIKKIWKLLKKNRDGNLEKLEYIKFHRIIYRLLVGPLDEDDWIKSVEEDWTSDSKGSETLSYEQFFDSLYQTADMWTESAHLSEYLLFAERLHDELEAWMAREQRKSTQPKPVRHFPSQTEALNHMFFSSLRPFHMLSGCRDAVFECSTHPSCRSILSRQTTTRGAEFKHRQRARS